jgi:hypothetical protein
MDFKKLADKAKKTIDERGGVDSLKADAEELKRVAQGKGSLTDKAKAAAQALKDPGDRREPPKAARPGGKERSAQHVGGEKHPAQHVGNPADTPRKGGPAHQ